MPPGHTTPVNYLHVYKLNIWLIQTLKLIYNTHFFVLPPPNMNFVVALATFICVEWLTQIYAKLKIVKFYGTAMYRKAAKMGFQFRILYFN